MPRRARDRRRHVADPLQQLSALVSKLADQPRCQKLVHAFWGDNPPYVAPGEVRRGRAPVGGGPRGAEAHARVPARLAGRMPCVRAVFSLCWPTPDTSCSTRPRRRR